ncbi:MAG: hypothetical protein AAB625_02490 [Patescibacteria group bacterium]
MKAAEKPKYVQEARKLLTSIDINHLISNPNDLREIDKINRLVAIFTNFSSNDGQELKRLFQEFQETGRRSTSSGTIKNRAVDVIQFIGQKIEEMDIYVIEPDEKPLLETLEKLRKIQKLIQEGLARSDEKTQIIREAQEKSKLFKDDIYKRKAEKLSKQTVWSKQSHDGFVAADEYGQLTPWIELLEDYLGEEKLLIREKVIEDTTPYEGRKFLRSILEKANNEVVVVDNFLSHEILAIIEPYVLKGVGFRLLTRQAHNSKFRSFTADYKVFRLQHQNKIAAKENKKCHDRFVMVDGHIIYHFGASLVELGNTLSVAHLIEDQKEKDKLLSKFTDWWDTGKDV